MDRMPSIIDQLRASRGVGRTPARRLERWVLVVALALYLGAVGLTVADWLL